MMFSYGSGSASSLFTLKIECFVLDGDKTTIQVMVRLQTCFLNATHITIQLTIKFMLHA